MEWITEENRISCAAGGETLAEVTFPALRPGVVEISHTFVSEALRGQGIAGQLMERAAAELRRTGRRAVLTCSYAQTWWSRHPEAADLLA